MAEAFRVITNNPLAATKLRKLGDMELVSGSVRDVYISVRDHIHKGHRLLTHPLMSSIKPNEVPYRTVLVTATAAVAVDLQSLMIVESSLASLDKFMKDFTVPDWSEAVLEDFKIIDYDLINQAISK